MLVCKFNYFGVHLQIFLFLFSYSVDIAHKTGIFGALDGTAFEESTIIVFGETEPFLAGHFEEFGSGLEFGDISGWSKSVPGTGGLASVAAVDGIAHCLDGGGAEVLAVFDGLIGETAMSVERLSLVRVMGIPGAKGMGGAGFEASVTGAAATGHFLVVLEWDIEEEFAEDELAAGLWENELMIASSPSESGFHGPVSFKDGGTVTEYSEIGT